MKSDLGNNDEVVIHHPIGAFPKWEAAIPQLLQILHNAKAYVGRNLLKFILGGYYNER
jgi:hypothetical protein